MTLLTVISLLVIFCGPAHAYLDPGSGSYVIQMAMAGILAAAYTVKVFWQRIKTSVMTRFGHSDLADSSRNG